MLRITKRIDSGEPAKTLTLPLDMRLKSRVKVLLDDGGEAGLFLERGRILRHGDLLQSACGMVIEVHAAPESVSAVYCDDALQLARACYHLGNRHIPLEIADGRVAYQPDHVLDDMVRGFGLEPRVEIAPFEPEAGAYGDHPGHGHG